MGTLSETSQPNRQDNQNFSLREVRPVEFRGSSGRGTRETETEIEITKTITAEALIIRNHKLNLNLIKI